MNHSLRPRLVTALLAVIAAPAFVAAPGSAAEAGHGDAKPVQSSPQSEADFLKTLTFPEGLEARVWASGTQIVNPVAIDIDDRNRVYAAETLRFRVRGVIDVREHMFLYRDDIKVTTADERRAMLEKWKDKYPKDYFTKYAERVRVLEDTAGAGRADRITVFADGFNDAIDGPAAGILVGEGGTVYLACAPKVWALHDQAGKGVSDQRTVIADGMGVRVSISGHDLHGLVWGPDGRIYWSLGDRGYHTTSKEGTTFAAPRSGGVFRSEPDGSRLEQLYAGLRNPQELAFDEWGDLFTVDNNADIGDKARVVYILEGGTAGWDHGWQLLTNDGFAKAAGLDGRQPNPWLEEGLWRTDFAERPTFALPPCGYATSGPSGLAYYPGTGFGEALTGQFLVCDYRGGGDSGVLSFATVPAGAGFGISEPKKFIWNATITDVAFGYDGNLYVANYLGGWAMSDYGRMFTLSDPQQRGSAPVKELTVLFAAGFAKRPVAELARLLAHRDQRVRQRAQFELARRGKDGVQALAAAATANGGMLPRVHGIWGLAQVARREPAVAERLVPLLADKEPRVREQAAKWLGDLRHASAAPGLLTLLKSGEPRARAFAAIALGRLKHAAALPELVQVLKDNDDKDPWLRSAAVTGLAAIADGAALEPLTRDTSRAARHGALLALRKLGDARVAALLADRDPLLQLEAIRAIYDLGIEPAMPALIARLGERLDTTLPQEVLRLAYLRLINAAHRYGDDAAAGKLAEFAANAERPGDARAAALKALDKWQRPLPVDPVTGIHRPGKRREQPPAAAVLKAPIMSIIKDGDPQLLGTAVILAQRLGLGLDDQALLAILDNAGMAEDVRVTALAQLGERKHAGIVERLPRLLAADSGALRAAAFDAQVALDPASALSAARAALSDAGATGERQVQVVAGRTAGDWKELPNGAPATELNLAASGEARVVDGFAKPFKDAGAKGQVLPRLTDGVLPATDDDITGNTWFDNGESRFVVDLKQAATVARVDTWSWHKANRAAQTYVLWGADGATMPAAGGDLATGGWTRLAKVETGAHGEGGKHGSAVANANGALGRFRWLLWQEPQHTSGTFFSEVAVYAQGRLPGGQARVLTARSDNDWEALAMNAPAALDTPGLVPGVKATWIAGSGLGKPHAAAGAKGQELPRLTAAELPQNDDDVDHNTWFEGGQANILLDLQQPVEVARISTYSWHRQERSPQVFTLWGSAALSAPEAGADPGKAGWTQIARVDTTAHKEGGKHGSCVSALAGALGRYRFVLLQNHKAGTFLSRIDVFAAGVDLPALGGGAPSAASIVLKQHVLKKLGALPEAGAADLLTAWLDRLLAGKLPPPLLLELTNAAAVRKEPAVVERLAKWQATLKPDDPLAPYRVALWGGDVEKGKELFRFSAVQCVKCHSVDKEGGNAGPDLKGVGNRLKREGLLESLVVPGAVVVPGFGTATVTLTDGTSVTGFLTKKADDGALSIRKPDNTDAEIPAAKVAQFTPPISSMPPMGAALSREDLRDIVAYLASLK